MQTIAVVGASKDRSKFGNKCVRAYLQAGWKVFPVHPSETVVEGLAVFKSVRDIPEALDRISVYLPPPVTFDYLADFAAVPASPAGSAPEVWFNPGAADSRVLEEARRLGLASRPGCSIVDIGLSPSQFS